MWGCFPPPFPTLLQLGSKALVDSRDTVWDSLPEKGQELFQVTGVALRCCLGLLICSLVGGKVMMAGDPYESQVYYSLLAADPLLVVSSPLPPLLPVPLP